MSIFWLKVVPGEKIYILNHLHTHMGYNKEKTISRYCPILEVDGDALPKLKLKISNKDPIRRPSSTLAQPDGSSFYQFPPRKCCLIEITFSTFYSE